MRSRRLISVLLVVAMLFSLSVSAFAAESKIMDSIISEASFNVKDYAETKTVTIVVHIEDYPELAGIGMIHDIALELYEKQAEFDDGTYVLMSKQHIAGELALHILLFRLFYILGGNKEGSMFSEYYNGAKDAELNIDEERLSPALMEFVGGLVLAFGSMSASSSDSLLSTDDMLSTDILL